MAIISIVAFIIFICEMLEGAARRTDGRLVLGLCVVAFFTSFLFHALG